MGQRKWDKKVGQKSGTRKWDGTKLFCRDSGSEASILAMREVYPFLGIVIKETMYVLYLKLNFMFGLGTPEILIILLVLAGIPVLLIYKAAYYKGKSEGQSNQQSNYSDSLYCSKCGAKNSGSDTYCSKCGNALK